MKIIAAFLFSSIVCFANDQDSIVTLSGTIIGSKIDSAKTGILYAQPWAYHMNIDSCKISSNGRFNLSLKKGHTYVLVFAIPDNNAYYKTFFINENTEVVVHSLSTIDFVDKQSYSARINIAGDELQRQMDMYGNHKNQPADWRQYQHQYDSLKSNNADSITIQLYLLSQICNLQFTNIYDPKDSSQLVSLFQKVPPSTPLWSYLPSIVFVISKYANSFEYVDKVIYSQPDPWTRGWLKLYYLLTAASRGDSIRVRSFAKEIVEEFSGTDMAMLAKPFTKQDAGSQYTNLRMSRLTVGMKLPEYKFPLLDKRSKTISNKNVLGKKYLLCFWATWCNPCLEQMPYLQSAYKKYHCKGLELVSVALDRDLNKTHSFLKNSHSMFRLNAYAPKEFDNNFVKSMGIFGIPTEFLIDEKGVILATSIDLLKFKLDQTLERVFKNN